MPENIMIKTVHDKNFKVKKGITAEEFFKNIYKPEVPVMACLVDGILKELQVELSNDAEVIPVGLNTEDGVRIYSRTLRFVLQKAVEEVLPQAKLQILHSLSKGYYCEFEGEKVHLDTLKILTQKMQEIIRADLAITRRKIPLKDAMKIYQDKGYIDKVKILKYREEQEANIYELDGTIGYFYGYMCPSTGYVPIFELKHHAPGFILRYPIKTTVNTLPPFEKQPKLAALFMEYERWCKILGVKDVGSLNEIIEEDKLDELILVAEALHEKKISQLADVISMNKEIKAVFIAGPSSSGKTTFAHRLMIQLRVNGVRPVTISLDDYFLDREKSPVDEEGNLDYDSIDALDLSLFNEHLLKLFKGEEVELPLYNFHTGKREYRGKKLRLDEDQVLIIEGIHGLNERLSAQVPRRQKFKIYVSALMQLNLDALTPIKTTDTRLIRRIVRDFQFRGTQAAETIKRWPLVRRGEENYIFPFQEEADAMFNSALVYELSILKPYIEPLLQQIPSDTPEFLEARRLLKILQYFKPYRTEDIPSNSIIKEFTGGCCFYRA